MEDEICPECDGKMKWKSVDYVRYGEKIGRFPAWVCEKCGIEYCNEHICSELDKLLKNAKNVKPKCNLTPEQMDELNENLFR